MVRKGTQLSRIDLQSTFRKLAPLLFKAFPSAVLFLEHTAPAMSHHPTRILTPSQAIPTIASIPPTPEQQGKENYAASLLLPLPHAPLDKAPVARYSHPNSPTPSLISQFNSPKLTSSTANPSPGYVHALSTPALYTNAHSHNGNHFTRPMPNHSNEPSVVQLLAQQPTERGYHARAADRDSTMGNATGVASWRKGQGFKQWEKQRLESSEVRRKADVAQLCTSSTRIVVVQN